MTNPIDVDVFRVSRPWSDYDFDVYACDEWIASAKNYHGGDDVAAEAWYRAMFTRPIIADVATANTDDEDEDEQGPCDDINAPPDRARCHNCSAPHHTWQCPEIRAALFAPFTDVCVSCGDQLLYDAPINSICSACQESGELLAA